MPILNHITRAPDARLLAAHGTVRDNIWTRALKYSAYVLVIFAIMASMVTSEIMTTYFLVQQDIYAVIAIVVFFILLSRSTAQGGTLQYGWVARFGAGQLSLIMGGMVAVGIAGHYLLLHGYAFSRDEQMALFDAEIFAHGEFAARLPEYWRGMHEALNMTFVPASVRGEGWVSSYRPVNAIMHMLASGIGTNVWLNPFLSAIGLFATWRVAVQLWPQQREAHLVTVLLYALSAQVLAVSMTSYAMPGHLAFNMIWLMLFLHDRWYSHLAAILVGILAIGMHQIVYHPLFAGPVLFCLLLQRRWFLSAIYAACYAAAILLWAIYFKLPTAALGAAGVPTDTDQYIWTRIGWALANISPEYLWIKASNMLRFFAWQHVLLLPLMLVGASAMVKSRSKVQIALIGALLTVIAFKLVMRPYQGHGWGYRYLHGLIGICCLIGAAGWMELKRKGLVRLGHFHLASAVTLCLTMPWLLWQASAFSGSYAAVDRNIAAMKADIVIVEDRAAPFAKDVVSNRPYLENRPIRLMASNLADADMHTLCARYKVTFVDAGAFAGVAAQYKTLPVESGNIGRLRAAMPSQACEVSD
ncbi:hypothetical protein [Sphingorhabdus sp. Alg239-R122]|uniref:hypothetical protein n=1 Tax=Sphingorhabdus sp. Alg239-R122 TaxID=2305989 RepID=UPI0013DB0447|nr:hypothetical protein [Sphingorhabdus sp. Alg239-R122]